MHALFMTRGIKRDVDEMVKFLETRALRMPFYDPMTEKKGLAVHQGNLQPIQFWSYVFPQYEQDHVLTSLKFTKENIERWQSPKMRMLVNGLRLAMGAKKIPEFTKTQGLYMPLYAMENISIIPIGVRYDDFDKDPLNGTYHEKI